MIKNQVNKRKVLNNKNRIITTRENGDPTLRLNLKVGFCPFDDSQGMERALRSAFRVIH